MADDTPTRPMLVPSQAIMRPPAALNNSNANDQSKRRNNNRRRNNKKKNGDESSPAAAAADSGAVNPSAREQKERNNNNNNNRRSRNRGQENKNNDKNQNQSEAGQPKDAPETQGEKQQPSKQGKKRNNNRKKGNRKRYPWRRFVPNGSVDPITLDPLVSLAYPPFALCADAPYDVVIEWPVQEVKEEEKEEKEETEEDRQKRLIHEQWGSTSIGLATETPEQPTENLQRPLSERTFNLFDGRALAYYMVSQLQFIDPLNRRDLTRDELVNLNHYLKRHGFHDLNVVDAYDARGITMSSAGAAASSDAGRAQIRQQEAQLLAQTLLDSIFAGNGASSVQPTAAATNPLQQQYAATQRQEQQRRRQNRNRNHEAVDRGIYGSEEAGLVVIDDDANPGLRGGGAPPSSTELAANATSFTPGTLWSASHITNRYQSHAESNQATNFPPLAAGAAPAAAPARPPSAVEPAKKGPSRSLAKITKLVAKTDPRQLQKQREARELFVKRAAMSNMAFGSDPTQVSGPSGLMTPGTFGPAATSKEASEGQLLRNQAFASALGVVPSTMRQTQQNFNQGWARPTDGASRLDEFGNELDATLYPDSLIVKARENMALTLKMEKKWAAFLADDSAASLPLNKMSRDLRVFVHEYSDHWKLHTESFDPEPHRYIHCVKLRDTSAPRPLLSEAARNWRGPRPVVVDLSDHAVKQTAGQTPREFGPPPVREPLQLKPRSTESLSLPPGFKSNTESEAQINGRSDELFNGRERPKLDLAPRTIPVELPPAEKAYSLVEERERQKALREEQLHLKRQEAEKKQRILESAFASESEEESLKSHDSADWDDMDEEAVYSGSDEEQ